MNQMSTERHPGTPVASVPNRHKPGRQAQPLKPTSDIIHRFNPYLHGARGLFSFMIVVFHVVNSRLPTFPPLSRGWLLFCTRSLEHGVELFFGISGVVIVGALARARAPLIFAIERGTRIYPVLWASVGCIIVLSTITGVKDNGLPSLVVLGANLLALTPLLPFPLIHPAAWSLSYEMAFYGFCALAWALRRRLGKGAFILIVPAALLAVESHVRIILMPAGMLIAMIIARRPAWGNFCRAPGLCLITFLLCWETIFERAGGDLTQVSWHDLSPTSFVIAVLAVGAAAFGFAGLLVGRGLISRLLVTKPMQFLGSVSYSLYLWHPIILGAVKHELYAINIPEHVGPASQLLFFALCLPPSILLAWISQRLLERRVTVSLRRSLEGLLSRRPKQVVPVTVRDPVSAPLPGEGN